MAEREAEAGLAEQVARLTEAMEKAHLAEYVALVRDPWRLVWVNFLAGSARGLGMAFGFTALAALVLRLVTSRFVQQMPVLGQWVAELVRLVQLNLGQ
ncbi:MAG: DUF5665 domain-containing protein [Firmicutes bacterium]|nr:DUF5665 domain-containing protein [Bacillota bacterium]